MKKPLFLCPFLALVPAFAADTLTGDWGGLRAKDSGVTIALGYTQEDLGVVSGGLRRTSEYDGLVSLSLDLDLAKLIGWPGATFHATGYDILGSSLSDKAIGDDSNVSNINFRNSVRLFELWLDQSLLDGRLSLRVGQLAADSEFFGTGVGDAPGGGVFLNSDFGAPPIASYNAPVPIYAIAAPGVRVRINPTKDTYLQVGLYDGNPAPDLLGDPSPGFVPGHQFNDHGTHLNLNSDEGFFLLGEAGLQTNPSASSATLPGSYKIGGYYHSDTFTRWSDGAGVRGLWAGYAIGSQKIWNENTTDHQGLYLFGRISAAPQDRATVECACDGGLNYLGLLPGRDDDTLGLGCSRVQYSGDLRRSQIAAGDDGSTAQTVLEITYQISVTPWLTVQPDFQYVFQPGGKSSAPDAAVLGLRVTTLF